MIIQSFQRHLSLPIFGPLGLPPFVVLTGINGSGKSQFLEALATGYIQTDLFGPIQRPGHGSVGHPRHGILRLDNARQPPLTMAAQGSSLLAATPPPMDPEILNWQSVMTKLLGPASVMLQRAIGADGTPEGVIPLEIWRGGPEQQVEKYRLAGEQAAAVRKAFVIAEAALDRGQPPTNASASRALIPDPTADGILNLIDQVASRLRIPRLQVTEQDLRDFSSGASFSAFSPELTKVFSAYRDAIYDNDLKEIEGRRGGTSSHLSETAFRNKYGPPPWEPINETLKIFGLNYRVQPPPHDLKVAVDFVLRRLDNNVAINLDQLSAGERVLLRFALALFQFDPLRVDAQMPHLLLLDEMDASLHPEMVHRWLSAIEEGLVARLGLTCILTTHSPTTVAMAPEESLFELQPGAAPVKVTKQHALNRLTFGVPTLSVDYEGRRQVFVESDTDAASFEILANLLKGSLELKRSVTFLATGIRQRDAEINAGCTVVRKLVRELRNGGNKTVYGLLDWDLKNEPEDRIVVLGQGSHYALDNLLLDPLLVGALLLKEMDSLTGFPGTYASLGSADAGMLQCLADLVQKPVNYPGSDASIVDSRYLGSPSLKVRTAHQMMNGHQLEGLLIEAHPTLNKYHERGKGRGTLTGAVVRRVLSDYQGFCPLPIAEAFKLLANADVD